MRLFQWPSPKDVKDDLRHGKTGDLSIDQVDRWQRFMTSYGCDLNLCLARGQQSRVAVVVKKMADGRET